MVKVYCPECKKIVNMYPVDKSPKNDLVLSWGTRKRTCPHIMTSSKKEKYQVHVRWFLKDGTELVSRVRNPQWELRKKR